MYATCTCICMQFRAPFNQCNDSQRKCFTFFLLLLFSSPTRMSSLCCTHSYHSWYSFCCQKSMQPQSVRSPCARAFDFVLKSGTCLFICAYKYVCFTCARTMCMYCTLCCRQICWSCCNVILYWTFGWKVSDPLHVLLQYAHTVCMKCTYTCICIYIIHCISFNW